MQDQDSRNVLAKQTPSTSKRPKPKVAKAKLCSKTKAVNEGASNEVVPRETECSLKMRQRHPAQVDDKEGSSTKFFVVDVPSRHLVRQVTS